MLKSFSSAGSVVKRPQVKILILERPPQALNENIVFNSATAIHADVYLMIFGQAYKCVAGKLSPLVGIKDFWRSIAVNSYYDGLDTKIAVQGVGKLPG